MQGEKNFEKDTQPDEDQRVAYVAVVAIKLFSELESYISTSFNFDN